MYTKNLSLELLPGEYWWGGVIDHGYQMPFASTVFQFDLSENLVGNQGAPLLLSNKGRFVWSEEPFQFAFQSGYLHVTSNNTELTIGEEHDNLRSVYRYVSSQFFPPSGKHPSLKFFSAPQYNTWIEMGYEPTQRKSSNTQARSWQMDCHPAS